MAMRGREGTGAVRGKGREQTERTEAVRGKGREEAGRRWRR